MREDEQWRRARAERRERRGARSAIVGLAVFGLTLAGGVWGLTSWLNSRAETPTNSCTAVLPDGGSEALTAEQADNAALITAISLQRGLPALAATIALATAMQESKIRNINYGDRDSVGLFQQRPSQGWGAPDQIMDPVYSTNAFYDGLLKVAGYESMEITVAAQAVQRSGFPDAYAQHELMARAFASALTGHSEGALTCDLGPSESTPEAIASAVAARLERDFHAAAAADAGTTDGEWGGLSAGSPVTLIRASDALPNVPADRAPWAIAQWAVATAWETGADTIAVAGYVWHRAGTGWEALATPLPAGMVAVG